METATSDIARPADDVYCWLEPDSSIMLKAVTRSGDPVALRAAEARALAALLQDLASRLDSPAAK